jgi:hypothetical protein
MYVFISLKANKTTAIYHLEKKILSTKAIFVFLLHLFTHFMIQNFSISIVANILMLLMLLFWLQKNLF